MQEINCQHLQKIDKSILAIVKPEGGQSVGSFVRLRARSGAGFKLTRASKSRVDVLDNGRRSRAGVNTEPPNLGYLSGFF